MNRRLYCITHSCSFPAGQLVFDNCIVTSCPPPKLPDNWNQIVTEPSPEELVMINRNARELELELSL